MTYTPEILSESTADLRQIAPGIPLHYIDPPATPPALRGEMSPAGPMISPKSSLVLSCDTFRLMAMSAMTFLTSNLTADDIEAIRPFMVDR